MGKRKERLPFWKRSPELEHIATHIGKKFDQLTMSDVRSGLELIGITAPFVFAERKIGGLGVAGFGTGLLADYFIRHKTMIPKVTILGNSYEVNAGYAMLMGVAGFLAANAFYGYGILPMISAIDGSAQEAARQVELQHLTAEAAQKEYDKAVAEGAPQSVIDTYWANVISARIGPRRG